MRLTQDVAVDREILQRLGADYDLQVQKVAELEMQLQTLKQQGLQLVKELRAGRNAAGVQSQAISRLQERIAAAERRLAGGPPDAQHTAERSNAKLASKPSDCGDSHEEANRVRHAAIVGAASSPPADPSDSMAAGTNGFLEDDPLMGQLLAYQARQRRQGRPRRVLASLASIVIIVASLLGLGLLLTEMFGLDPFQRGRAPATFDRADRGVSGALP